MDFVFGLGRSITRMVRNAAGRIMGKPSNGEYELPKYTFWDTIEEFGYHFNKEGKLVDNDGGGFKFFVKEGDRHYNQQHYDALGELVTEYLYNKMETDLGLHKVFIPVDAEKEEPQGFIFSSPQAMQGGKLMVIINGAGVVRAGQWSRKLILNEGIEVGSQFPYIRRARDSGFEVLVLNTNQNQQVVNGKTTDIRGSETAEDHGVYVWEHIIRQAKAKAIVIVAHSYGGMVTCSMVEKFLEDFQERVFCIVFTDSVHTVTRDQWSAPVKDFLKERAVNFASTYVPLDYIMQSSNPDDCLSVSAGTEEHERTSPACMDSAFRFILTNLDSWTTNGTPAPSHHFRPLPDDPAQVSTNRWTRAKGKEGREGGSSMADASGAAKRNAADMEEAVPVAKNGERGPDREKSGATKDEEFGSKNEERGPEGGKLGSVKDEGSVPKSEERSSEGKKTGLETESETKPEMTKEGENTTVDTKVDTTVDTIVDTTVKAEVKQEPAQDPDPAASSPEAAQDPDPAASRPEAAEDQDQEDLKGKEQDTDRGTTQQTGQTAKAMTQNLRPKVWTVRREKPVQNGRKTEKKQRKVDDKNLSDVSLSTTCYSCELPLLK